MNNNPIQFNSKAIYQKHFVIYIIQISPAHSEQRILHLYAIYESIANVSSRTKLKLISSSYVWCSWRMHNNNISMHYSTISVLFELFFYSLLFKCIAECNFVQMNFHGNAATFSIIHVNLFKSLGCAKHIISVSDIKYFLYC